MIIVGGGIAGLRVGIETLKKKPYIHCCILEKYDYIGGRIVTYHKKDPKVGDLQWEIGAGRISITHKKVLELFKEYNLEFVPIRSDIDYVNDPSYNNRVPVLSGNKFSKLIGVYLETLQKLPRETLKQHTIKELLDKIHGPGAVKHFYEQFPYYSEIHLLRADLALESFNQEMSSNEGFGVCKEGLSSLTELMMSDFIAHGGTILMNQELYKIISNPDRSITLHCRVGGNNITHTTTSCVLALHSDAVKKIDGVKNIEVLSHLKMAPLLRMYAVFPSKRGVSWLSGLNSTVTNSRVRYIIPINAARGIVMISYTDGADAKYWIKEGSINDKNGNNSVKDLVMSEVRALFPDRTIPDPIIFKQYPWYNGCTYWKPGAYNVEYESYRSLHPKPETMPNLFMCGESFAVKQCWIESALEQADKLLNHRNFVSILDRIC